MSKAKKQEPLTSEDMEKVIIKLRTAMKRTTGDINGYENFDADKFIKNLVSNHSMPSKREAITKFVHEYIENLKIYDKLLGGE